MPRLDGKVVRQAKKISALLPPLLPANRSIERALLELKWIKDELPKDQWHSAVNRRLKLEPLQYILGNQPFGDLNIICEQGVLIPRWETEEWCTRLADLISENACKRLVIVDACTGSGCIPLYLRDNLASADTIYNICGFDISKEAIHLAHRNLLSNRHRKFEESNRVSFQIADISDANIVCKLPVHKIDLVTANPPYIPLSDYKKPVIRGGVEKSVRQYEPQLALIGDVDPYKQLLCNLVKPSQARGFIFEVGYYKQVDFVRKLLDRSWAVGYMNDSAGRVRCVVGWKLDTDLDILERLCDAII
ncbi:hypothetical protein KGF57_005116 [Candida theae]|uniref:Methyltransferase small domain-containing protein n=1 Tax=Candida theae TaxID=1198502 RepID=A0AAD5BAV3_9ASCO|nr:uncharacterized protein KGF57_005116 [Candida theae]KAI5948923.1 hypothetical protein KGF57_005116 [Candida theae]